MKQSFFNVNLVLAVGGQPDLHFRDHVQTQEREFFLLILMRNVNIKRKILTSEYFVGMKTKLLSNTSVHPYTLYTYKGGGVFFFVCRPPTPLKLIECSPCHLIY